MHFNDADMLLEYEERILVLKHLVRCRHIMSSAADRIYKTNMFDGFDILKVVWDRIYMFWDELKELIPEAVLIAEFKANAIEEFGRQDIQEVMDQICSWYRANDLCEAAVRKLLNEFFSAHALEELRDGMEEGDEQDQRELIVAAHKKLSVDAFSRPTMIDPFEDWEVNIKESVRRPIGMPVLDNMLEGGPCDGDMIGLIAPAKGGKTLIGMHCAHCVVGKKEHVIYISGEQALRGDMMIRMCVLASGEPRSVFTGGTTQIPIKIRELIGDKKKVWSEYFHFVDMSPIDYVIPDIETLMMPLSDAEDRGWSPRLVVIDWWGCFKDKLLDANPTKSDAHDRRMSRNWMQTIKQYAVKYKAVFLVLHQLRSSDRSRSHKSVADSTAAQEDASFDNRMDFCFVVGRKSDEGVVHISLPASRSTANSKCICFMNGPRCILTPASSDMTARPYEVAKSMNIEGLKQSDSFKPRRDE